MEITFSATVYPSEDHDKVKRAILNLVDPGDKPEINLQNDMIIVKAGRNTLDNLIESIKNKNAVPMFLRLLNSGRGTHRLMFNKQAAHAGKIVMCDDPQESPLGPIYLTLNDEAIKYIMSVINQN